MIATSLVVLQQQFLARLRGLPDGALATSISGGRTSRVSGLDIYTHAYGARLRAALEHDHPALGVYLGDELWEEMCRGYIAARPSRQRSLRDFGHALPEYLAHAGAFRSHPVVAELAAFERCLLDSFDAADADRVGWDALLSLAESGWPSLRPAFHPSLRLHRVATNSVEAWREINDGHAPPAPGPATCAAWAVWRDVERISRFRSISGEDFAALTYCLGGGDFAGLCESLREWHVVASVPTAALEHLRKWSSQGWVSRWG